MCGYFEHVHQGFCLVLGTNTWSPGYNTTMRSEWLCVLPTELTGPPSCANKRCVKNNVMITVAFNKIQHVYHVAVGRVIFEAWHNVTLDAKRTREYFEVITNISFKYFCFYYKCSWVCECYAKYLFEHFRIQFYCIRSNVIFNLRHFSMNFLLIVVCH